MLRFVVCYFVATEIKKNFRKLKITANSISVVCGCCNGNGDIVQITCEINCQKRNEWMMLSINYGSVGLLFGA